MTSLTPFRVPQKEAMRLVSIKDPHAFNKWVLKHNVPYTLQGNTKLFRVKVLEEICEAQEKADINAIRKPRKNARLRINQEVSA